MKTTTYICDNCGKGITTTDSMPQYRLILHAEYTPHNTNFVNAVLVSPPFTGEKVFCGTYCLKAWVKERYGD